MRISDQRACCSELNVEFHSCITCRFPLISLRRCGPSSSRQKQSSARARAHTQLIVPGWPACLVPFLGPAVPGCAASVSAWPQTRPLTFPAAWPWWWSGAPAFWSPSSAPRFQYCSFPYLRTLNCPSPLRRPVSGPADPVINSCLCTTTLGTGRGKQTRGRSRSEMLGGGVISPVQCTETTRSAAVNMQNTQV